MNALLGIGTCVNFWSRFVVCMTEYASVYVCTVCTSAFVSVCARMSLCVCCARACVRACVRTCVHACVCVRERESVCVCEGERESVCVRERERERECVCLFLCVGPYLWSLSCPDGSDSCWSLWSSIPHPSPTVAATTGGRGLQGKGMRLPDDSCRDPLFSNVLQLV